MRFVPGLFIKLPIPTLSLHLYIPHSNKGMCKDLSLCLVVALSTAQVRTTTFKTCV